MWGFVGGWSLVGRVGGSLISWLWGVVVFREAGREMVVGSIRSREIEMGGSIEQRLYKRKSDARYLSMRSSQYRAPSHAIVEDDL